MTWRIVLTDTARQALRDIADLRERELVAKRIDALGRDPDLQGKRLNGELARFRAVRAAGQRYRILYELQDERVLVVVVHLGRRKEGDKRDVYELARKLFHSGLL